MSIEALEKERRLADRARARAGFGALTAVPADVTRVTPRRRRRASARAEGASALALEPASFDPRDASGERLTTPVRFQQMNDPRCVAFAIASAMETWWCRHQGTTAGVPRLSIQHIFELGDKQELIGPAAKGVKKGALEEACFKPPTPCSDVDSHKWKGTLSRVNDDSADPTVLMRRLLREGRTLVIAIPIFENFDGFTGAGTYTPSGNGIGAHALCIVGYEEAGTASARWVVKNSYGENWGDGGYGRLRFADPDLEPERVVFMVEQVVNGG